MKPSIKRVSILLAVLMAILLIAGCANTIKNGAEPSPVKAPKYIFLFIGDGMAYAQVSTARVYIGNGTAGSVAIGNLNSAQFPVSGVATTYDTTSICPDSASTATAIACGIKTASGVLGLGTDMATKPQSITEKLKAKGMKIGIVTTVTLNHATPAAFYAHAASRDDFYGIGEQMAASGFDYFAGGAMGQPTGSGNDRPDLYGVLQGNGYRIAKTKEDILSLNAASGKVYAVTPKTQDSGSMPYAIDAQSGDLMLADFVKKGIDVLDNEKGFFMMAESGKIDWACHANDAASAIADTIELADAVQVAMDFAAKHPDDTLILVTGDHETGGMSIGYAATGYTTDFNILKKQKMSYVAFNSLIADKKAVKPGLALSDLLLTIKENFGLIAPSDPDAKNPTNKPFVLTTIEYGKLKDAFAEWMKPTGKRSTGPEAALLYGSYNPLSVTLTHIIGNKAGIGWTTYAHTGMPVPVYAMGTGAALFGGSYDNTDIFKKLVAVCGL